MQKARILARLLVLVTLLLPSAAWAQYKNSSFGLDVSYLLITRPPIRASDGSALVGSQLPDRLAHGYKFGGEYNFKLHADHWWFTVRLDGTLYEFATGSDGNPELQQFDFLASSTVGTVLGVDGKAGIRYFFLTDHVRPFVEAGLSVEHLFTFTDDSSADCTGVQFCSNGGSYGDTFLPHTTFLGLHLSPGLEVVVAHDVALHFILDFQRWVIINADDNTVVTLGVGVTLF